MIFSSRLKFPKPSYHYKALKLLGGNIIAAEFDEWKRHRKVAAPAFSEVRGHNRTFVTSRDKRWLAEKQQTRFRGDHESDYLAARRRLARQGGGCYRQRSRSHEDGRSSDAVLAGRSF